MFFYSQRHWGFVSASKQKLINILETHRDKGRKKFVGQLWARSTWTEESEQRNQTTRARQRQSPQMVPEDLEVWMRRAGSVDYLSLGVVAR